MGKKLLLASKLQEMVNHHKKAGNLEYIYLYSYLIDYIDSYSSDELENYSYEEMMEAFENASRYFQQTLENVIPYFLEYIKGILEELKKGE